MTPPAPDERFALLLLTLMKGLGPTLINQLADGFGSAQALLEADARRLRAIPRCGEAILAQRSDAALLDRARRELGFAEAHGIHILQRGADGYPERLSDVPDAPPLLFHLGSTPLASPHVLAVVGTRSATAYGRDFTTRLIADLRAAVPDLVVVSGLALGIDVAAHRAALAAGVPTAGIVAHGLDRIYPSEHRQTAGRMVAAGGGILTEYPTGTTPQRGNFLARNRIIAALADATLVVESKARGGALVTASIARSYGREVLAVPGRATDERSRGCNRLIRQGNAGLVADADDVLDLLQWAPAAASQQQTLSFAAEVSPLGQRLLDLLTERGRLRSDDIAAALDADLSAVAETLLDLEIDGLVRTVAGGAYETRR